MRQRSTSATATSWKLGMLGERHDVGHRLARRRRCSRDAASASARPGRGIDRNGAAAAVAARVWRKRRRETGGIDMPESVAPTTRARANAGESDSDGPSFPRSLDAPDAPRFRRHRPRRPRRRLRRRRADARRACWPTPTRPSGCARRRGWLPAVASLRQSRRRRPRRLPPRDHAGAGRRHLADQRRDQESR